MLHLGLMITKDDDEIIDAWFSHNAQFFDGIVCLDGSRSQTTKVAARRYPNVHCIHESKVAITNWTDHGLRAPAHELLIRYFGPDCWITLCHADEFFYHDPRRCCERAERNGFTGISWYAVHFLPHSNDLLHWQVIRHLPIPDRFRYYHWDYAGTGTPWLEFRSYRNSQAVRWEPNRHGSTQPRGCEQVADFHPSYRHFKVFSIDLELYERDENCTRFKQHWQSLDEGRTGVPWIVTRSEDLFVSHLDPYRKCDYYEGAFDHHWNIGEQFR